MVGKITDNKDLSGSLIVALMGHSQFTSPNTLLTNILGARGVAPFTFQEVEQNEAMLMGDLVEPLIVKRTADILGIDKVTDKVRVPYHYHHDGKKLFSVSLDGILHVETKKTITIDDRSTFAPQGLNLDFVIEGDGNLEVKNTRTYFRDVPLPHLGVWQLQAGLMATKRKWGVIAILYSGSQLCLYFYKEDAKMQKAIVEKCLDFYKRVEAVEKGGEIGDYMYPSKDPNDLAMVFDSHDSDAPVVDLANVGDEILEINQLKSMIKTSQERIKELEAVVMKEMGNSEIGEIYNTLGETTHVVKWITRHYKAQRPTMTKAKPERYERAKSLTIKEML
jgi:predicted phage-related endonuclease